MLRLYIYSYRYACISMHMHYCSCIFASQERRTNSVIALPAICIILSVTFVKSCFSDAGLLLTAAWEGKALLGSSFINLIHVNQLTEALFISWVDSFKWFLTQIDVTSFRRFYPPPNCAHIHCLISINLKMLMNINGCIFFPAGRNSLNTFVFMTDAHFV